MCVRQLSITVPGIARSTPSSGCNLISESKIRRRAVSPRSNVSWLPINSSGMIGWANQRADSVGCRLLRPLPTRLRSATSDDQPDKSRSKSPYITGPDREGAAERFRIVVANAGGFRIIPTESPSPTPGHSPTSVAPSTGAPSDQLSRYIVPPTKVPSGE
jgi:hypothetical protein